jgi:hypothetical protein
MKLSKILLTYGLGIALITSSVLLLATPTLAAEEIVFEYGILHQRLAVSELTTFAETGETSRGLAEYFRLTKSNPESIRQTLNQPLALNSNLLDYALNNPVGERLLDELGKTIQTPNGEGNREALQTALLESTARDQSLTLLEMLQHYPTDEIHLDVERAIQTYNRLAEYQKPFRKALETMESLRQSLED